jgi:hypothetical protein
MLSKARESLAEITMYDDFLLSFFHEKLWDNKKTHQQFKSLVRVI